MESETRRDLPLAGEMALQAGDASGQPIHRVEGPLEPGHPAPQRHSIGFKLLLLAHLAMNLPCSGRAIGVQGTRLADAPNSCLALLNRLVTSLMLMELRRELFARLSP